MQTWFNIQRNQWYNSPYQQTEKEKPYDYLNRFFLKSIGQNRTSFHNKNTQVTRNRSFLRLIEHIILDGEKLYFSSEIGRTARCLFSLNQCSLTVQ